jgi:hypothetical protein
MGDGMADNELFDIENAADVADLKTNLKIGTGPASEKGIRHLKTIINEKNGAGETVLQHLAGKGDKDSKAALAGLMGLVAESNQIATLSKYTDGGKPLKVSVDGIDAALAATTDVETAVLLVKAGAKPEKGASNFLFHATTAKDIDKSVNQLFPSATKDSVKLLSDLVNDEKAGKSLLETLPDEAKAQLLARVAEKNGVIKVNRLESIKIEAINKQDAAGNTMLGNAASVDTAIQLMKFGADTDLKNAKGETQMDVLLDKFPDKEDKKKLRAAAMATKFGAAGGITAEGLAYQDTQGPGYSSASPATPASKEQQAAKNPLAKISSSSSIA